jgi:hypothetical protein
LQPLPWLSLWLRLRAWLLLLPLLRPPLHLSLLLLVMLLKRPCLALLPLRSLPQLLLLQWLVVMLSLQSWLLWPLVWALLRFR